MKMLPFMKRAAAFHKIMYLAQCSCTVRKQATENKR